MTISLLLVDDEVFFRERLGRAFEKREYKVFLAEDYDQAMAIVNKHRPEMAVVDLRMPGKSGLELIKDALVVHPDMRIVVLTGYGSIATATEAVKHGAVSFLPKPADVDDILNAFSKNTKLGIPEAEANFQAPSLARMEWEHINRVLHDCQGNISAAAKKLGLHRRTLQRKLNKFPPDN
jgi:two-component system response regulator RegA